MTRIISALLFSISCVFAQESAVVDAPYIKVFDPWHACMAAEALAKRGAPDALRTCFLAAYVRANQPFLGGEGDETMSHVFERVLATLGDDRFSRALAKQRPEIRSAVACFLSAPRSPAQKTIKLLRDAPKIDWPMVKASRDDYNRR
jgi:hypothetical protein